MKALAAEGGRRWAAKGVAAGVGLVLLVLAAYGPALRAQWIWDDDWHITNNLALRTLGGLGRIWFEPSRPGHIVVPQYYPLTHTTFWLEYQLAGARPWVFHLDNVLLHGLSAVLLWRVLRRLGVRGAWAGAALWAVHPVLTESVAWATERKNVLSGVLYLAALLAYMRFRAGVFEASDSAVGEGADVAAETGGERRRWGWYAAALGLYLGALLAKTVASTWPAAVLLILWWKRGRVRARDVAELLPFFVLGAGLGSVTSWMERHVVGASGPEWSVLTPADRVLIAGRAVWFYAAKLVWPAGLSFNYERWTINAHDAGQWAWPVAAVVVLGVLFALRRRLTRGPLTACLFFVGTLTPALGFFDVYPMRYSFVADHFQYLASVGLIALTAALLARLPRGAYAGVTATLVALLGGLTFARAEVFHDPETLWADALAKNPQSWLAHANLEKWYAGRGELEKAVEEVRAAVEIRPGDAELRSRLAMDLSAVGDREGARRKHEEALRLGPGEATVHFNYGQDLGRWGDGAGAEREYREALRLDASVPGARNNLGLLMEAAGDERGAEGMFREEIARNPGNMAARTNLANLLLKRGEAGEAESVLRELLEVDPGNAKARNTLAIVLMGRKDVAGAERQLRLAVAADPGLAEAHNTLGGVLAVEGKVEGAIAEYREALRLKPDFAAARRNLEAAEAARRGGRQ